MCTHRWMRRGAPSAPHCDSWYHVDWKKNYYSWMRHLDCAGEQNPGMPQRPAERIMRLPPVKNRGSFRAWHTNDPVRNPLYGLTKPFFRS